MGDVVGVCYAEKDFIDYLNRYICEEPARLITTFKNVYDRDGLPEEYLEMPYFDF